MGKRSKRQRALPSNVTPREIEHAMALHRGGDLAKAETLYRKFLRQHPDHADVMHLIGAIALQRGRFQESVELVRQALDVDPDHPFFHNTLGEAFRAQGKFAEAELQYRAALRLNPSYAQAHNNLGMVLHAAGDYREAVSVFTQGLTQEPNNWDLHNNLGVAHQALGQWDKAVDQFQLALELQPQLAEACHNYATALKYAGRLDEARKAAERCLNLAPGVARAVWNLADIYTERGMFEQAEPLGRRAIELDADVAEYHNTLARIVREQGRFEESINLNRQAITIDPGLVQGHNDLGVSLMAMGEIEAARESLLRGLDLQPEFSLAYENLVRLKRHTAEDQPLAERIRRLHDRLGPDNPKGIGLYFALGKIFDDMGEHEIAFDHYEKANRLKRATFHYDPDAQDQWTRGLLSTFRHDRLEQWSRHGDPAETPFFILGMPRSGTSLVEQILASHPLVHGAGELIHFYDFTQTLVQRLPGAGPYPGCAAELREEDIQWMAQTYLEATLPLAPEARYITDKMPMNYLHLGLITSTFPKACIILCERDERDVCLSLYFQHFAGRNLFAYDLYEIGRYYRQYRWVIEHWIAGLGARITTINYETLVTDLEATCRCLLSDCGLSWDERCLHFHETRRPVHTASGWQVRQPIHTASVARWKNYQPHLGLLEAGLAGMPRPEAS